jgi:Icc-related predicted phosphoesterase
VGDLHVGLELAGQVRASFEALSRQADLLLLAGDLTQHGDPAEASLLARELIGAGVPIFAVLGNHDYHYDRQGEIRGLLEDVGVTVLEGEAAEITVRGVRVGIGGSKGFGGGFLGACGTEFGEPEMKAFIRHTKHVAEKFRGALAGLDVDLKIGLLHFSPIEGTLQGERLEIYPFLGSYMLGEAVDRTGCMLAVHGHAHRGTERGVTAGGVPVRNVARTVIQRAYKVFEIGCSRTDRKIDYHRTVV